MSFLETEVVTHSRAVALQCTHTRVETNSKDTNTKSRNGVHNTSP